MSDWLFNHIAQRKVSFYVASFHMFFHVLFPFDFINHIDYNKIFMVINAIIRLQVIQNKKEHVKGIHRNVTFPCNFCDYKVKKKLREHIKLITKIFESTI